MAKRRIAHRMGFEKCPIPWKELKTVADELKGAHRCCNLYVSFCILLTRGNYLVSPQNKNSTYFDIAFLYSLKPKWLTSTTLVHRLFKLESFAPICRRPEDEWFIFRWYLKTWPLSTFSIIQKSMCLIHTERWMENEARLKTQWETERRSGEEYWVDETGWLNEWTGWMNEHVISKPDDNSWAKIECWKNTLSNDI